MCRRAFSVRSSVRLLPLFSAALLVLLHGGARGEEAAPGVELILRGGTPGGDADPALLPPAMAFELRFAAPMVAADQVGQAAAESPLAIAPPLPGLFRWTSQRGGVFTPSEPAPPLGTSYQVTLRSGLRAADGTPVRAELHRTFRTPPLEVQGVTNWYDDRQNPSPGPRVQLLFNAAVDPGQIARSLAFRSPMGQTVPVAVSPIEEVPPFSWDVRQSRRTWRELFTAAHTTQAQVTATPETHALRRVMAAPAAPLPPAGQWTLVAAAGLTGLDPGAVLPADVAIPAPDANGPRFTQLERIKGGGGERRLVAHFSRSLDKEAIEHPGRWLRVSPGPEDLKFEAAPQAADTGDFAVAITGRFERDQIYEVTALAGLPSQGECHRLAEAVTRKERFALETPQIAFPDYRIQQLGSGRREIAFSALNAPVVRVRAKLVPPGEAGQALAAYDAANHQDDDGDGKGKRMDFDRAPGEVVFDREIAGSQEEDKPRTVTLRWDDLLGARPHGVVLLEAEQPRPSPGQTKRAGAQAAVQVTDLGVVWKTSPGGALLAYAFSMTDAAPARANVRLLDAKGLPLTAKHPTGADGVATLTGGADEAAWLSVVAGDDCHVLPFKRSRRDALGLYRFHLPASAFPPEDDAPARGEDAAAGDAAPDAAKATAAAPKPPRREVLIFSERGVYKPGEEAHVKAVVRQWSGGGLGDVPPGTRAALRAFDAKGRCFWQQEGALTAAGSLDATVPLPRATLGRYRVEISLDGKKLPEGQGEETDASGDGDDEEDSDAPAPNVCRFQVQEYQPNAFEVRLAKPAAPPVGAGAVALPLTARYYMGKTLSRAKTVWSLKAEDTRFEPAGFDEYVFGGADLDYRLRQRRGELALDGQGALDAQGALTLAPQIVLNTATPGPRRVRVQASVTDQDQQTVTARQAFTVHSSDFYLALRQLPEVVSAGEALPLEVVAVQAGDGQPRPEPVKITARLSRVEWRTHRVANDSGNSDYDNQPDLQPVGKLELTTTGVRRVGAQWQPAAEADTVLAVAGHSDLAATVAPAMPVAPGAARGLVPPEPGEYLLEVATQDAAGRAVLTSVTFSALGDQEAEWGYRNAWQLPLVPDKAEYRAGDTATLLVKTPISGRALVTVERAGVSRAFVTEIRKEHPIVRVPILPGDAPNVYVSVLLMRGAAQSPRRIKEPEYRAGYCQLLVPKADTRLAVEVRPAQPECQPGEEMAVAVAVTDERGRPAPGAEVTLYAVDRGVLSLTGYLPPDALKAFYHPRPLEVATGLTLPDLFTEDSPDLAFAGEKGYAANKGYLVGGGGGEGQGDRLRQNFVACAYWSGSLVTDAQGRVSARFPAPDSLTEYAVYAVVHQGGRGAADEGAAGRFGGGQGSFRVNKPLMLEPALPRFGNVGDHLLLRAVAHNQSPSAGEAEITLDLDGKAAFDGPNPGGGPAPGVRRVHLAAGESRAVDIPVVFTHTGDAVWTWHARLQGEGPAAPAWRDTVRSELHVDHPTPRRAEVANRRLDDGRAEDLLARVNPELMEGEDGVIQVGVTMTRLGELSEGVDELLHYPYGCVEQTTSSLLPWLTLKDFKGVLPTLRRTPQEADDAVARGVNRLLGMQTDSGGLAYWPGESGREPHPWGSAYGGLGLALAKRAGYFVPAASFEKLCKYLSDQLRSDRAASRDTYHEHNETDRCLALYALALAGKGEPAYYEKFFARRDELSPEDRTLLALAVAEDKGSPDTVRALLQPGPRDREQPAMWNVFASGSVLDAQRLLAWCRFEPQNPAVEDRLGRLLDGRSENGGWLTTQGNAWALLALSAYARDVEKPAAGASGTVALGGRTEPFQLRGQFGSFQCEFPLDAAAGGREKLSVAGAGKARLYVQTKVESRPRGGAALTAAPSNGLGGYGIRRQYEKLLDDGTRTDAKNLAVGDRVLVSLDIEAPDRASYVAVNDPLPAVLEAVNPEFKTSGAGGNAPSGGFNWWVSDFRELRTDRAVFFCDNLYAGRFHLQYLARVRAAGTATAPAAKVEEMYHPDRYAETPAASLSSKGLE